MKTLLRPFTRSGTNNKLIPTHHLNNLARHSYFHRLPSLWNATTIILSEVNQMKGFSKIERMVSNNFSSCNSDQLKNIAKKVWDRDKHTNVCVHTHIHTHIHMHVHTNNYMYEHIHMCTCVHIYTHMHTNYPDKCSVKKHQECIS